MPALPASLERLSQTMAFKMHRSQPRLGEPAAVVVSKERSWQRTVECSPIRVQPDEPAPAIGRQRHDRLNLCNELASELDVFLPAPTAGRWQGKRDANFSTGAQVHRDLKPSKVASVVKSLRSVRMPALGARTGP